MGPLWGKTFPSRLGVVPTGVPTGGGLPSILTALRVAGAKQNRGSFAHGGEDPPRGRQVSALKPLCSTQTRI